MKKLEHAKRDERFPQVAVFQVRVVAVDKPTDRKRWNGGPMASKEASAALKKAVDAFRASLAEEGFEAVSTGSGVSADWIRADRP